MSGSSCPSQPQGSKTDLCFRPRGAGTLLRKTDKMHLNRCHRQPLYAAINKPKLARLTLERVTSEKSVQGGRFLNEGTEEGPGGMA